MSLSASRTAASPFTLRPCASQSNDWGFNEYAKHSQLYDAQRGYVVDGIIEFQVRVLFVKDLNWYQTRYDSKTETGMVGFKNQVLRTHDTASVICELTEIPICQGATCYMNSLLQTLYHLQKLRLSVYNIPTESEDSTTSVVLGLQRVFHSLQTKPKAVDTCKLTKAFGWDRYESFMQHDVQELNRVLCDNLEEKMKKHDDNTVQELFEGKCESFIRCLNVEYESKRTEAFYDIQLDVKGCKTIEDSFAQYVKIEKLIGENQYDAGEQHGKQDAEKGLRFTKFPPVLTIHLKRYTQSTWVFGCF